MNLSNAICSTGRSLIPRFGVCAIIVAGAMSFGAVTSAVGQTGDKVRMGGLLSLSGGAAVYGASFRAGMEMAMRDINAKGGIKGKPLELVFADDQTDPTLSVGEAKRLLFQEKLKFVVGPIISAAALAAAPSFVEAKAVNIGAVGSSKFTPQAAPNSYSFFPPAATQAQAFADYLSKIRKAKSVAFIGDTTANPRELNEALKQLLPALGIAVTGTQEYAVGTTDLTAGLLALRRTNPEILIVTGISGVDVVNILKGINELGWKVEVLGSASFGTGSREIIAAAGSAAPTLLDGVAGQAYKSSTYCPADPMGASPFAKFSKELAAFTPDRAKLISPIFAGYSYDAVMAYKAAIESVGEKLDGPGFIAWLEANYSKVPTVALTLSVSPASRWIIDKDAFVMATDFHKPRADGLFRRLGC